MVPAGRDDQWVAEKKFHVQTLRHSVLWKRQKSQIEIVFSIVQSRKRLWIGHRVNVHDHARIFFHELFNDPRQQRGRYRSRASDLEFASGWIGQEFKVSDALLEFVE